MGILSWVLLGLVAGVLAKWLLPTGKATSWLATIILGIVGAFVGGFVGSFFGIGSVDAFNIPSIAVATGGACLVLFIFQAIKK